MENKQYLIEDLCELSGFSRRTIRYYVQLGLIDPPAGRGRGGFYTDTHLQRLLKIKELQDRGMRLEAISVLLQTGELPEPKGVDHRETDLIPAPVPGRDVWARFEIIPGIEVHVSREMEQKDRRRIFDIIQAVRTIINKGE